jgi:D-sedoheptulose 7-phosphate isomerase
MSDYPEIDRLVSRYRDLTACRNQIEEAFTLLRDSYAQGGVLLICGNGGSAADSDHMVGELMKGFQRQRPVPAELQQALQDAYGTQGSEFGSRLQGALPAISLTAHSALVSAIANDTGQDLTFAQQVYGYGRKGDVLLGISTSGNSENVCNAMRIARTLGLTTIALTGRDGGQLRDLAECVIRVPRVTTLEIQELHLPIYHTLCVMLEQSFFN